jgi:hypothetical protein
MNNLDKVKLIEKELDEQLNKLTSGKYDPEKFVILLLMGYERCCLERNLGAAENFKRCLDVILPEYIDCTSVKKQDLKEFKNSSLQTILEFSNSYYILRELLYYTYNTDSINWSFKNNKVKVNFKDKTIPWQFRIIDNNYRLKSREISMNSIDRLKLLELLSRADEFTMSDENIKALEIIGQEVEIKLNSYYNFFTGLEDAKLGTYTVSEFTKVFKAILTKALYHRYYNRIKKDPIPISIKLSELIEATQSETGVPVEICRDIFMDISYNRVTKQRKIQPMHCCLYYFEDSDTIWMSPNIVCFWEGFVNILRISAIKDPNNFQKNISGKLSENFTNHLIDLFTNKGFICIPNIKLNKFDSRLPDIDILVISKEPSLGYVLYCVEVKNQIPAIWSKDHIRVLSKEGITKGIDQIQLINEFLNTEQGIDFIHEIIPKINFPESFNGEFLMLIDYLIVSSFNTGMFFGEQQTKIIDYHSLSRIINKSDGDIAYIKHGVSFYKYPPEKLAQTVRSKLKCGRYTIDFEFAGGKTELFDFPDHTWKKDGYSDQLMNEYLESGFHPFMYLDKVLLGTF